MKRKYIEPQSDTIRLYMETSIAVVSILPLIAPSIDEDEDDETEFSAY